MIETGDQQSAALLTLAGLSIPLLLAARLIRCAAPATSLDLRLANITPHAEEPELLLLDNCPIQVRRALEPAIVKEWPGYYIRAADERLVRFDGAVALVDPAQALIELTQLSRTRLLPDGAPAAGTAIVLPMLSEAAAPAQLLQAGWTGRLDLPVLRDATCGSAGTITQYVPIAGESVLIRRLVCAAQAQTGTDENEPATAVDQLTVFLRRLNALMRDHWPDQSPSAKS